MAADLSHLLSVGKIKHKYEKTVVRENCVNGSVQRSYRANGLPGNQGKHAFIIFVTAFYIQTSRLLFTWFRSGKKETGFLLKL